MKSAKANEKRKTNLRTKNVITLRKKNTLLKHKNLLLFSLRKANQKK